MTPDVKPHAVLPHIFGPQNYPGPAPPLRKLADATDKFPEGIKFDDGKLRYSLIPPEALAELARVFTRGAQKYEDWNWLKGMKWSRIYDAVHRHMAEWRKGYPLDAETKLRHLAQAMWGMCVLLEYERLGVGEDDRRLEPAAIEARKASSEAVSST